MVEFAVTRTNEAVSRRLANIARRLVAARQATANLRDEGQDELADLMQATIDRLTLEELAWRQWQMEGFRSPTLDRIRKAQAIQDERSEQRQAKPVQ